MGVNWTSEQRKAIESRNGALLVSAAAGSGKTAVLVERLLRFVENEGCDIDKFLMITYTNAAASELRAKIIDALHKRVAANPGNRHLMRQMNIVHRANISTIHAYCMQLLRTHGHYLDISSDFKIADEAEANELRAQILEELLEEKYEENTARFQTLCETVISGRDDRNMVEIILKLHSKSRSHPNPEEWLNKCAEMYEGRDSVWEREIIKYINELCENFKERIDVITEEIKYDSALDAAYSATFAQDKKLVDAFTKSDDWDELYKLAENASFARLSSSKGCTDEDLREKAKTVRNGIKSQLETICKKYLTKTKAEIEKEIESLSPAVAELCSIAKELDGRFTLAKVRRGIMDYSDLEHFSIELLIEEYNEKEDIVVPTTLAKELSEDFCEIMVDEYQDSNCIQDVIFRAISKNEKNLTMVGDLKQSIYRFRLADPTIFLNKYKSFTDYDKAKEGEARVVNLSRNFRSRTEVLDTCNKYFTATMSERLGELDYTEREYLNPRDDIPETERNCESELVVVDLEKHGRDDDVPAVREAEAMYIASRIQQMKNEGIPYEDVVILLRSQANRASIYERALSEYGIPCVSEKREGILETVEVSVVLSFLQIIDNPLWDVPLVSVLRSPLFAFTADDLAKIRRAHRGVFYHAMEVYAKGEDDLAEKVRGFIDLLAEFRDMANEISTDKLIWKILDTTGARGLFGAMNEGSLRISNLNEFYNYARRYESSGFRGVHSFLNHMAYLTEHQGDIAGENTEGGAGAVKIMSIHKSKGLEFPVVFLADCSRKFNETDIAEQVLVHPQFGLGLNYRDNELRYECPSVARNCISLALKNEMRSEELRVLYVAMTRAKDKLIAVSTQENAENRIKRAENTILNNKVSPLDLVNSSSADMWFLLPQLADSSIFKMKVVPASGIDLPLQYESKTCTADGEVQWQTQVLKERFEYEYPYESAISAEGKFTATGIAHESVSHHHHFVRPRFEQKSGLTPSERGIAIHLVMQFIDFTKCNSLPEVKDEIRRLYSDEYITEEQYRVIPAEKIYAFFQSELGKMSLNKKIRREFNFSRLIDIENGDTALLQGVVDLIIEDEEGMVVVDFKSDATINDVNVEQYKRQLEVYKESLEIIFNKRVKDCYLYFLQKEKTIKL